MLDGRFVLRLNKDIWNKQLGIQCPDDEPENHIVIRKRGVPPLSPLICSPHCKHNGQKSCKICKANVSSKGMNEYHRKGFRRTTLDNWLFSDAALVQINRLISEIPHEIQNTLLSSTKQEANLSAIGILSHSKLIKHIADLRVESIQRLMRPLVQRLMQHPRNVNVFNVPVDHVGLQLLDYLKRIPTPMDLGTVKSRVLRGEYSSVESCAADIALVFENALSYNPPNHLIHQIARLLYDDFESEMRLVREKCSKEVIRTTFINH